MVTGLVVHEVALGVHLDHRLAPRPQAARPRPRRLSHPSLSYPVLTFPSHTPLSPLSLSPLSHPPPSHTPLSHTRLALSRRTFSSVSLLRKGKPRAQKNAVAIVQSTTYKATSLMKKRNPLGPYRRPLPRALWQS